MSILKYPISAGRAVGDGIMSVAHTLNPIRPVAALLGSYLVWIAGTLALLNLLGLPAVLFLGARSHALVDAPSRGRLTDIA
jgi:hypothetical protein